MPRFSLIVATIGRTDEFSVLLQSLANQTLRDFELIVVDQNSDDRLSALLDEWAAKPQQQDDGLTGFIQVMHLHCAPGVSRARNLGLLHSSGEILAFPDDDCWYQPDTLQHDDEWIRQHAEYGILSLGCRDDEGKKSGNHWWQAQCDLKPINIFRTSGTCCFFVLRPLGSIAPCFDEALGPGAGTSFGCGEDTDFLLTLMSHGIRGRFNSLLYVGHPRKDGFVDVRRAERYGGGFGRVMAKHSLPLLCFALVTFDFSRAALRMLLGEASAAARLWAHGRAMLQAYFSS